VVSYEQVIAKPAIYEFAFDVPGARFDAPAGEGSPKTVSEALMRIAQSKYGEKDGYTWSNSRWGVKWPVCDKASGRVRSGLWFDSPWGPPGGFMDALAGVFPDVNIRLKYEESGMEVSGSIWASGGTASEGED
jgi:hypothetical protein